jgi:hypothetical protein
VPLDLARALPGWFHRKTESDQLRAIAADYQQYHRRPAAKELRHFRMLRTDQEAISKAALAQLPTGKRHPHQYRIPLAALQESERRLLGNLPVLRQAKSFDHLFELVAAIIQPIRGIGELAVYDTAVRVGARFECEPTKVYLHAGTRLGAKALGLVWRNATLELTELPVELRTLTARELEDLLCIYKDEFNARSSRMATTSCGPDEMRRPRRSCPPEPDADQMTPEPQPARRAMKTISRPGRSGAPRTSSTT